MLKIRLWTQHKRLLNQKSVTHHEFILLNCCCNSAKFFCWHTVGQRWNWKWEKISAGMGTAGVWLQVQYCVLNTLFCNYLTKEMAACISGGQGSARMP